MPNRDLLERRSTNLSVAAKARSMGRGFRSRALLPKRRQSAYLRRSQTRESGVKPYRIAIIGIGKITQDQHLPVIAKDQRFELAALVSQRGQRQAGVPTFRTPAEL
jgi:hypothetical protein